MLSKFLNKIGLRKIQQQENFYGYIFILPWIIGMLAFTIGPLIFSFITSFSDYNMLKFEWVGVKNYVHMFTRDPLFVKAFKNTLYYSLLNIPLITIGGVLVAILLHELTFGVRVLRTVYYLPSVMVGVGTYFLWMFMLNPSNGLVNTLLGFIGIEGPAWLTDPRWTKPAIIVMNVWGLGGQMLLYLSRLQSIPRDLYESAAIDGANKPTRLFKITLPMLTPIIFYNLIIGIIGSFQVFQQGYIFSGDGSGKPAGSLLFYNLYVWNHAFKNFNTGYANAMAWFLFAVVMVITLILQKTQNRWVFYEGGDE